MTVGYLHMRKIGIESEIRGLRSVLEKTDHPVSRGALIGREEFLLRELAELTAEITVKVEEQVRADAGVRTCIDCGRDYTWETTGGYRCRECRNALRRRKWDELSPEEKRSVGHKAHKRALTPEQFAAKSAAQGGACVICGEFPADRPAGRPRKDGTRSMVSGLTYDHCHESGLGRDLLCHRCNVLLGMAKDDPERLEAAAAYLRKWKTAHEAHAEEPGRSCAENGMADLVARTREWESWRVTEQTQLQPS
jgi:hypothetical protein